MRWHNRRRRRSRTDPDTEIPSRTHSPRTAGFRPELIGGIWMTVLLGALTWLAGCDSSHAALWRNARHSSLPAGDAARQAALRDPRLCPRRLDRHRAHGDSRGRCKHRDRRRACGGARAQRIQRIASAGDSPRPVSGASAPRMALPARGGPAFYAHRRPVGTAGSPADVPAVRRHSPNTPPGIIERGFAIRSGIAPAPQRLQAHPAPPGRGPARQARTGPLPNALEAQFHRPGASRTGFIMRMYRW